MATRFYMPSGGTPGSTPSVRADWERSIASFTHWPAPTAKTNTALTDVAAVFGATTTSQTCWRSFVSAAIAADQTLNGTVSIVLAGLEGAAQEDAHLAFVLRVMQGDTSTERGLLLVQHSTASEFTTSQQTRIHSALTLSSVNALTGDRIVMEIGIHAITPANANNITLRFGDPTGTADFALTSGLTTDLVPWFEMSTNVNFGATPLTVSASDDLNAAF
jgi:hypothetical protein